MAMPEFVDTSTLLHLRASSIKRSLPSLRPARFVDRARSASARLQVISYRPPPSYSVYNTGAFSRRAHSKKQNKKRYKEKSKKKKTTDIPFHRTMNHRQR